MPTIPDILTLQQWLSPAFPLGSFAYSHGLETEIVAGRITSVEALQLWLQDILNHGAGHTDAILIRAAATDLEKAEELAQALAPTAERLRETREQGAAFQRTTAAIWGGAATPLCLPVAFGAGMARAKMPMTLGIALYLQAFTSNLVSAAVRLVPLGQTEGQHCLAQLTPLCHEIAEQSAGKTLDDIGAFSFLGDIASMQHEALEPRVFRT